MKKIVGVITLLCMSASMLNMHAGSFALTDMTNFGTLLGGDNSSPFNIQGIMGGVVESGLCGDDLSWYFSTDKVLIITGNGDMNNYTAGTAPWYEYASEIKEIELSDDITFIGNYAFYNCTQITEINIPDTVTEIGYDAFKNCSGIENIEIPDTVTIIGTSAFEGCSNLQEITLPQNLSKIYTYTFALCKKLKNIIIPDEVTIIESGAFTNCTAISEIYIPENITEIGKNVFYGCESLETVIYGGNEEQWNNINVKTGNSLLEDIDVQYLKNEEKTEYVFCGKLLEDDSVIYDENDNAICEECLNEKEEDPKTECSVCGEEITKGEEYYDDEGNVICSLCSEDEKIECIHCGELFEDTEDLYDDNGDIVCPYCEQSQTENDEKYDFSCMYCGNAFYLKDADTDNDGNVICPDCNEIVIDSTEEIQIDASDWELEEMNEAYTNNIIPEEMIDEDFFNTITRQEFVAVAVKLYESISGEEFKQFWEFPFTDCDDDSPYINYISAAYKLGITNGTGMNKFSPNELITRQQIVTMMYRVIRLAEEQGLFYMEETFDMNNIRKFADDDEIADYAKESVYFMGEFNIVKGVGNSRFEALYPASKEQAVAIALRIFNYLTS